MVILARFRVERFGADSGIILSVAVFNPGGVWERIDNPEIEGEVIVWTSNVLFAELCHLWS